ncbi:hypothetical protein M885DRAFT_549899 [Pelagophyceae sp. CCMP2097]|nr:hypothetical protein M885DRAFT_549899 [Pelagophyceae sp. CCMP2097]
MTGVWPQLLCAQSAAPPSGERDVVVVGASGRLVEGAVEVLLGGDFERSPAEGAPVAYFPVHHADAGPVGVWCCAAPVCSDAAGAALLVAAAARAPCLAVIAVDVSAAAPGVADVIGAWSGVVCARYGAGVEIVVVALHIEAVDDVAWPGALARVRRAALGAGAALVGCARVPAAPGAAPGLAQDAAAAADIRGLTRDLLAGPRSAAAPPRSDAHFGFAGRRLVLARSDDSQRLVDQLDGDDAAPDASPVAPPAAAVAPADDDWLAQLLALTSRPTTAARAASMPGSAARGFPMTPDLRPAGDAAVDSGHVRSFFEGLLAGDAPLTPLA